MSDERWHGKNMGYTKHKCRCAECKAAHAARGREFRAKQRANGQCIECQLPSVPDNMRCATHLESARARWRRYVAKKRASAQQRMVG